MEPSYMILGADGKQYGPVSAQQFLAWAREGRVDGATQVRSEDSASWIPASSVAALNRPADVPPAAAPQAVAEAVPVPAGADPSVEQRIRGGVSWFYWIAGLSVVNSVLALAGAGFRFIFGLGITQLIDNLAHGFGGAAQAVALALDCVVAGVFIVLGIFASKRQSWAFIVGLVLLVLDGALTALFRDWISVAFHAFVLYVLFKAYQLHRATLQ
jgi:hypothetical protein